MFSTEIAEKKGSLSVRSYQFRIHITKLPCYYFHAKTITNRMTSWGWGGSSQRQIYTIGAATLFHNSSSDAKHFFHIVHCANRPDEFDCYAERNCSLITCTNDPKGIVLSIQVRKQFTEWFMRWDKTDIFFVHSFRLQLFWFRLPFNTLWR